MPDEWAEIERLQRIIRSAHETVKEMIPLSRAITGLPDDLLDLLNILAEGLPKEADHARSG